LTASYAQNIFFYEVKNNEVADNRICCVKFFVSKRRQKLHWWWVSTVYDLMMSILHAQTP